MKTCAEFRLADPVGCPDCCSSCHEDASVEYPLIDWGEDAVVCCRVWEWLKEDADLKGVT